MNINGAIATCDAFLTACQPRAVRLAQTLGISVEEISNTIFRSGYASQFDFLLDETPQEEIPRVPSRTLRDRKATADVVKVSIINAFPNAN
jgi:hypothetical protein